MKERFIKLNGNVYYESELNMMSNNQLENLISECKRCIEEIERKSSDYIANNTYMESSDHYQEVVAKFKSASVYLQADIVMIAKILKARKTSDCTTVTYEDWCREFVEVAKTALSKRKWAKFAAKATKNTGYLLQ